MTLVELLVVLAIVGLLAVTALPLLVGNRDKKSIRNAADTAESMFSHVSTRAMTSPTGAAVWLETGTSGAGAFTAVTTLALARVPASATGTTTIARSAMNPATDVTVSLSLSASLASDLPAPIEFAGVPGMLTATGTATVTSATTSITGAVNRTGWNSSPPLASTAAVPYTLYLPPRPSSLAAATPLPDGVAIDLSASRIGLGSTATPLVNVRRLAVEYDRTGSPTTVWSSTSSTGGGWSRLVLTPETPVVLAIGMQSQANAPWVAKPTDDDPGCSWQSPYARWLVIDPRNGGARVIEAGFSGNALTANDAFDAAIAPVVEDFKNIRQ